jgi:hypothetical protein
MRFLSADLSERRVIIRPCSRNEGRRTMFDALLYCQVICQVMADIRHGYFLIVADFLRTIAAQFRALWATAPRALAHGILAHGILAHGTLAQTSGRAPIVCWTQEEWTQGLARLETYVASMA